MSKLQADLRLPAEPASLASARRFTESCLGKWKLSHLTDTLNLLVTELVTNAVVHGGTEADLKLLLDSARLRVEVRDGSSAQPKLKNYSTTATTGRGMQIVDALADRWGTRQEEHGKVVWLEFDVRSQSSGKNSSDGRVHETPPAVSRVKSGRTSSSGVFAETDHQGPVAMALSRSGL